MTPDYTMSPDGNYNVTSPSVSFIVNADKSITQTIALPSKISTITLAQVQANIAGIQNQIAALQSLLAQLQSVATQAQSL